MKKTQKYFIKLLSELFRSTRGKFGIDLLFSLLKGAMPLAFLWVLKEVLDFVVVGIAKHSVTIPDAMLFSAMLGIIYFFNWLISLLAKLIQDSNIYKITNDLQEKLLNKISTLPLFVIELPAFKERLYKASREISFRPSGIYTAISQIIQLTFSLVLVLSILVLYNWWAALILVLAVLPLFILKIRFANDNRVLSERQVNSVRKAGYYNRVLTGPVFAKEQRVMGLFSFFNSLLAKINSSVYRDKRKLRKKQFYLEVSLSLVTTAVIFMLVFFILEDTITGGLSVGSLFLYVMILQRGAAALQGIVNLLSSLYEHSSFLADYYYVLDYKAEPDLEMKIDEVTFPLGIVTETFDKTIFCWEL